MSFAWLLGRDIPEGEANRLAQSYPAEMSFEDMRRELEHMGVSGLGGVKVSFEDLIRLDRPAIAHLSAGGRQHFVVVERATSAWVRMLENQNVYLVTAKDFQSAFSGAVLCLAPPGSEDTAAPRADCGWLADLSAPVQGEVATATFSVRNAGQGRLRLLGIMAPPDCSISAALNPKGLAQGESGQITISLQAGLSPSASGRAVQRNVVLFANDPSRPLMLLTAVAPTAGDLSKVEPARLPLSVR